MTVIRAIRGDPYLTEQTMRNVKNYHRPESVEEALALLARENVISAVLAGGTHLNARLPEDVEALVDLQAVGLDEVTHSPDSMALGAMVRVQQIVDDDNAPALLRELARREGPNTFRQAGTLGGAIMVADPESELVATLLVYEGVVTVTTPAGAHTAPLDDFLAEIAAAETPAGGRQAALRGGILTGMTLSTGGATAHTRVARTPEDS
ncbi:MAG TPA: FAD binding domain-containing protein, partial [Candidatus Sulfomarinibacteraceae bacterium]|nr:FAD binding domain-containing protein [Candidatus Sulfomarinibacteraceae bacterium]